MKKMKISREKSLSFEEGCDLYLNNCRERNLREGTIKHYRQSYTQFYKFFDRNMLVSKITQKKYNEYILFLRSYIDNDVIISGHNSTTTVATIQKICDGLEITIVEFFSSTLFDNLEQEIK